VKIGEVVSEEKILIKIALRLRRISSNISGCTGPIFTIFHHMKSLYVPMMDLNNKGKLILRAFFARLPDGSIVSFRNYLLLMPLYRVKFGEARSSSFGGKQLNKWNLRCVLTSSLDYK